jgi:putative tributyrin esterase
VPRREPDCCRVERAASPSNDDLRSTPTEMRTFAILGCMLVAHVSAAVDATSGLRRAPPAGKIARPGSSPSISRPPAASRDRTARDNALRGRVQVDTFWSQALGIRKQVVVYLPPSYDADTARRYPVAYYLHGLWGDEWNWVRQGRLDVAMDSLASPNRRGRGRTPGAAMEMIVVMPDGDDGWYTTWNSLGNWAECRRAPAREREGAASYCVPWPHYDEYIARDLVAHTDSTYRTLADRAHRGIAGLSMGGYGAVTLALRYPDVFAAAASHSGVLAPMYAGPHPFAPPPRYATSMEEVRARWQRFWWSMGPAFGSDTAAWFAREPSRLARRLLASGYAPATRAARAFPALFLDAGRDDALVIDDNRALHAELAALGVPHRYTEWPGGHDWTYWRTHVGRSLAWLAGIIGDRNLPAQGGAGGARE